MTRTTTGRVRAGRVGRATKATAQAGRAREPAATALALPDAPSAHGRVPDASKDGAAAQQVVARAQTTTVRTKGRASSQAQAKAKAIEAARAQGSRLAIANPISWADSPDPTVLRVRDDFYVATTQSPPGDYQHGAAAYPLRKAVGGDFNHLVDVGHIFPAGKTPSWLAKDAWAPEFHHDDELGYTVSFTGRDGDGKLCIGLAFADRPEGPYVEKTTGPFLRSPDIGVIDSHVFFDDKTGKRFFYWKEDWNDKPGVKTTPIFVQELVATKGGAKLVGERTQVLENTLDFERNLVEGQSVVARDGKYFMFYSAGPYYNGDYVTSVARADKPTGPWEKLGANIMPNDASWEGRGHGFVAPDVHGNDYFVCHGYPAGNYEKRVLLMFPIHWENGWPRIDTASPTAR